uniref:Uncharacterized protein n=1 Tax=Romanomermis culicivorax TaxID=13658 RepID=A0A915IRR8_ROMCU
MFIWVSFEHTRSGSIRISHRGKKSVVNLARNRENSLEFESNHTGKTVCCSLQILEHLRCVLVLDKVIIINLNLAEARLLESLASTCT